MKRAHGREDEDRFRRMALGLRDAVEGAHMGHPDFRMNGRIFASLHGGQGTVKLTPEQQADFMRDAPAVFAPASGAWGRQGWTTVRLDAADDATLGESLTLAWQNAARQAPPRTRGRSRSRGRPR